MIPALHRGLVRLVARTLAGGILLATIALHAAPFQLLSARNSTVFLPSGGNGNSASPTLSADGRFVLFVSSANDLIPGGYSQFFMNLYLRDRMSNTTILVGANTNGAPANGNTTPGILSTNARWVLFESDATDLVPHDTNSLSDIFVRDLQTGSNILVNVAIDGGSANGRCYDPTMTPDGRYVVFYAEASNLIADDTNGITDVFVRDLVSQTTTLVSVGAVKSTLTPSVYSLVPTGPPAITPDGRFVAFFSAAHGMAAGVASGGEVYIRDLVAGTTTWASSNATAFSVYSSSGLLNYHPKISDDGRFVVFKLNLYDSSRPAFIFQYDASLKSLSLVTSNAVPQFANDDIFGPEMTPDGRFIAFVSGHPTNQPLRANIYLADTLAGTNVLVSVRQDGTTPTNADSDTPVLSADGRYVAFVSSATNLVTNAISGGSHIYLRDLIAGATTLIDAGTNGAGASDEIGNAPSLSADGKWIAFAGPDGNFVPHEQDQTLDVFVHDINAGTNELISQRDGSIVPASSSGVCYAGEIAITPNGRWVVFASTADDLVTNDFNHSQDIFVRDLALGNTTLASAGLDGNSAAGFSGEPVISSNGQFVAFFSTAPNLVANFTNIWGGIFLRDLAAGTNALVSVSFDGIAPASGIAWWPAMSPDGRYIAFVSTATNLVASPTLANRTNVFWRDMVAGTTVVIATNTVATFPPSLSADGRYVAYAGPGAATAAVWDSQTLTNIYNVPGVNASAVVSPNGAALLSQGTTAVKIFDLALKTNVLSMFGTNGARNSAQWSADGRFVTFVARSNVFSGPFTNRQVFLADTVVGTISLISSTADHSTAGNGPSDSPTMSGNGRIIVYRSDATDIVPGTLSTSNLIVFDRATGSNTLINIGTGGADWTGRASRPLLDAAVQTVAFQSVQSGLVPGDINRSPDVFAGQPAILLDTDGDGIPDWWMSQHFGHATGSAGDHSLAQDDADSDGFSNLQEFLGGTDPMDGQSFLKVQISPPDTLSNTAALSWPSVAGKSYQVQYKTNLDDPAWLNFGAPVVATSSINITVPLTSSSGFYRVIAVN